MVELIGYILGALGAFAIIIGGAWIVGQRRDQRARQTALARLARERRLPQAHPTIHEAAMSYLDNLDDNLDDFGKHLISTTIEREAIARRMADRGYTVDWSESELRAQDGNR